MKLSLFHGKRQTLRKLDLTEAERRVLHHGVTPDCPICQEAVESLKTKGINISSNWNGAMISS